MLLFGISFLGTLYSSLTASGSTVVTLPLLLAIGIPVPLAIAIQKLNGVLFSLIAGRNYARGQQRNWRFIVIFSLIGLGAAYAGLNLLLSIDEELVRRLFGGIILGVIAIYFFRPELGTQQGEQRLANYSSLNYLMAVPFGLYEGFLGSGNALMFCLFAVKRLGVDMLTALSHYYTIAASWVVVVLGTLFLRGHFDYQLMLPAMLGAMTGAIVGTRFVAARGNKFIRIALIAAGSVLAVRLLLFGG